MLSCGAVPLKAEKVLHQLTYRGTSIILVEINLPGGTTNQKHYRDLGSDTSSVWNLCARFSDVIWRGNQRWRRQMSAVFSGYFKAILKLQSSQVKRAAIDIIK